jgi:hypothetical protein
MTLNLRGTRVIAMSREPRFSQSYSDQPQPVSRRRRSKINYVFGAVIFTSVVAFVFTCLVLLNRSLGWA